MWKLLMGETDCGGNNLVLMVGAMLSKSLIQFSVDGWIDFTGVDIFRVQNCDTDMKRCLQLKVTFLKFV